MLTGFALLEHALRQPLAMYVAHDRGHVAQASRVMARQHREAVRPWRAFPARDR